MAERVARSASVPAHAVLPARPKSAATLETPAVKPAHASSPLPAAPPTPRDAADASARRAPPSYLRRGATAASPAARRRAAARLRAGARLLSVCAGQSSNKPLQRSKRSDSPASLRSGSGSAASSPTPSPLLRAPSTGWLLRRRPGVDGTIANGLSVDESTSFVAEGAHQHAGLVSAAERKQQRVGETLIIL